MAELKIGILYLGLHNQLVKKYGANHIIARKEFFEKIGRFQHLPKNIRPLVLKEMQEMNLIQRTDRDNIKILSSEINIEEDTNKLYQLAGIY